MLLSELQCCTNETRISQVLCRPRAAPSAELGSQCASLAWMSPRDLNAVSHIRAEPLRNDAARQSAVSSLQVDHFAPNASLPLPHRILMSVDPRREQLRSLLSHVDPQVDLSPVINAPGLVSALLHLIHLQPAQQSERERLVAEQKVCGSSPTSLLDNHAALSADALSFNSRSRRSGALYPS